MSQAKLAQSVFKAEPAASGVTIEHRVTNGSRSTARSALLFGMKPAMAVMAVYGVAATGAWAFLLPYSMSLSQQVDRLEEQNQRLESEVDELTYQVDRYAEQNKILEENNAEFTRQNDRLNVSNTVYEQQNDRLNTSIAVLGEQNDMLNASNVEYQKQNGILNETSARLAGEVGELETINANLTATADDYAQLNKQLTANLDRLTAINANLTTEVNELSQQVIDLEEQNDRLQKLNNDLNTILSFIQEEAENVEETYEALTAFLSDQIEANRNLILERMSLAMSQLTTSWICGFGIRFAGFPFMVDRNSAIGATFYPLAVVDDGFSSGYVEEQVLTELCLDNSDFELFLANFIGSSADPPVGVTVNQLQSGVFTYNEGALDHYFPDVPGQGLTPADWAEAGYDCANLPSEKRYFWGPQQ